ncbi:MAG: AAA family ATPase [Lentisphaeria bacterium]|nr:AAA family ATPase [Lentisphaeria bacterium]
MKKMTLSEIKDLKLKGWDWDFTRKNGKPIRVISWHKSGKNIEFQLADNMIYFTSWKAVDAVKNYLCDEFGFDKATLKSNDNVDLPELGNIKVGFNNDYFEIRYKYEQLPEDFEKFYNALEKNHIIDKFVELTPEKGIRKNNSAGQTVSTQVTARQVIYFGAPGTSKSYTLNKDAEKIANQERVTFYPGYSYQQFVGTYKPCMVKSKDEDKGEGKDKITYKFVPGPLLRLLEKALKAEESETSENQEPEKFLLIVEELNRAEAAAVFGDLFQLLDRDSTGKSEYPISVSEDLKQYLRRKDGVWENEPEDTQKKLSFPSNFYIWATMNSADQGVFPLDTAFKRRWDFRYFGIDDAADKLRNDKQKFWNKLRQTINKALQDQLNLNEDKLLGPFFMKVENINEQTFWERFCSKVLLYLYEDAARLNRNRIFQSKITYSQMFAKFAKFRGAEEKWQEDLKKIWNTVFTFDVDLDGDYPKWSKAEAEETEATEPQAEDNETVEEAVTENSGETTDEQ